MARADAVPPGKSVTERAFAVLMSFDMAHRQMTLSQISRRSGLPVATTFRLLNHLEAISAVQRDPAGRYAIGPKIWQLGILAPTHDVIGMGTRPLLLRLATKSGMMVRVFVCNGEQALCLEEVLANGASAPGSGPGMTLPLVDSAAGHILMGGMTPAARSSMPLTRAQFVRVEESITAAMEQGWARRSDVAGHVEYAVPIRAEGRPPMALSLSTPPTDSAATRPTASIESMIPEMRGAAHSLAVILASVPDPSGSQAPGTDPPAAGTSKRDAGDE
ncbi:IclR family transcriptional regulator [Arthrobacter sp. TB 26]|uniref:IclR family transcriptional regulator n=1 Tax=Arthrobacter sp. TB 26 TaxID=494420 RepID=UPI00042A6ADD|nr:helix-turn-helix domain-containing protein [Arthrobacter sp. TB 26]